ncbi:MAG: hypothetical protein ACO1N3_00700 [Gammaproteobacteria bacterium]
MDFKSEIEQHAQTTQARGKEELRKIHQLQDAIVELQDKSIVLQNEIDAFNTQHATLIKDLDEKKSLIIMWEARLEEHKNKLETNEMLYDVQKKIKKNSENIQRNLQELEIKKEQIQNDINKFYAEHHISSTLEKKLNTELINLQAQLDSVINNIEHLEAAKEQLNFIVKFFLELLRSTGWITDPSAIEQQRLVALSTEIANISDSIKKYNTDVEKLEELKLQDDLINLEKDTLLAEQDTVRHIEEIEKSISESKQTIKSLQLSIATAKKECKTIQKTIAPVEKKNTAQKLLRQEISDKKRVLREKTLSLSQIDNPARNALNTSLVNTLLQTLSQQEQAQHNKHELAKTSKFFKPNTKDEIGPNSVPNFSALAKIQNAIRKYQNGIATDSQEHRILSQIITKILLWQMQEDSRNTNTPFNIRQNEHQKLCLELGELIEKLPFDNPMHGAQHYLESLTTPEELEIESSLGVNRRLERR